MREILFRGKTEDGKWVYGFYLGVVKFPNSIAKNCIVACELDYDYVLRTNAQKVYTVIPETVGQFTGLTDKNGKKIFEGDIVNVVYTEKRNYQGVKYDDEIEMIETVIYYEKHACFMLEINNEGITLFRPLHDFESKIKIKEIEVIGNIHDNSELLKEIIQ